MSHETYPVTCDGCGSDITNNHQVIMRERSREEGLQTSILCDGCAVLFEKQKMIERGEWQGYISDKTDRPHLIKDLCVDLSFVIVKYTVTNERAQVWFRGPDGAVWLGVSAIPGSTTILCNRTKHKYISSH